MQYGLKFNISEIMCLRKISCGITAHLLHFHYCPVIKEYFKYKSFSIKIVNMGASSVTSHCMSKFMLDLQASIQNSYWGPQTVVDPSRKSNRFTNTLELLSVYCKSPDYALIFDKCDVILCLIRQSRFLVNTILMKAAHLPFASNLGISRTHLSDYDQSSTCKHFCTCDISLMGATRQKFVHI